MTSHLRCHPDCHCTFSSQRGLTQHRTTCQTYIRAQAERLARASTTFLSTVTEEPKNKRIRLGADSDVLPQKGAILGTNHADNSDAGASSTLVTEGHPNRHPHAAVIQGIPPSPPLQHDATNVANPGSERPLPSRRRRLPARYRDLLPQPESPLPAVDLQPASSSIPSIPRVILHVWDSFTTQFNKFGIARAYRHRPSHDPDSFLLTDELSQPSQPIVPISSTEGQHGNHSPPWPWSNMSIWRIMSWKNSGSSLKSDSEVTRLVRDVLQAPDFSIPDLSRFDASRETSRFDAAEKSIPPEDLFGINRWKSKTVEISIPTRERQKEGHSRVTFSIDGFRYRPILDVVRAVFAEVSSKSFHLTPFKRLWRSPTTGHEQHVYDELYTSDAWIEAHDEIMKQQRDDDDKLERVVAGLMFWSDSTRLAQFGHASAWPIYLFFGNLSKYARSNPESRCCHPIAFIPSLPEAIKKVLFSVSGKKHNHDLIAHSKRELVHAIWSTLLDDDFIEAYKNGIVVTCFDGITRRVYPRVFTYSADYPEKVLLATIRDKGHCPCPRCLIPKSKFHLTGMIRDLTARLTQARAYLADKINLARKAIYMLGRPLKGTAVETLLKEESLVPTLNAFCERLLPLGFKLYPALVVDLLHEFELGILKLVMKHLLRIVYAIDPRNIDVLNERFTKISSFGLNTIRSFPPDVADTSQRPARFFEQVLLCSIPVFEGLFPPVHDSNIQRLLFRLSEWHALAKLRMHTDNSLTLLHRSLRSLSDQLRHFQRHTCTSIHTRELPMEAAQRQRREMAQVNAGQRKKEARSALLPKTFNLNTYKFHALGDYVTTIKRFGTTDSFTMQIGELAHRQIKKMYGLSNKKAVDDQFAKQERRRTLLRRQQEREEIDETENTSLLLHHSMARQARSDNVFGLSRFLFDCIDDPAVKPNFISDLKDHLLSRLLRLDFDGDERSFTPEQHNELRFLNPDQIVESKTLRINYTSYDIQRSHDYLRTDRYSFLMTLSREDDPESHPFWYCQLLKAFCVEVYFCPDGVGGSRETMEVLWVRWLGMEPNFKWNLERSCTLPKIGFLPDDGDSPAFGFLDPSLVIRGCHLIPAFIDGRTDQLLRAGPSVTRKHGETDDWARYYVNIFADRDMFMRYAAIGVGHDTAHLGRDAHGLPLDDQLAADNDERDVSDSEGGSTKLSYRNNNTDGERMVVSAEEDDEDDEDGNSDDDSDGNGSLSESTEDSDFESSF